MVCKIAFFLDNQSLSHVDFSSPEKGNPGCGGTEYLFVATPYYLQKFAPQSFKPILFAKHTASLPSGVDSYYAENIFDALEQAKSLGVNVFVYRPRRETQDDLIEAIESLEIDTICWAHITPHLEHLDRMFECKFIRCLVCVEHEQYDQIQDTKLACDGRVTYIVNGFDVETFCLADLPDKDNSLVVYLGALVPQKGFHLLAKVWPRILKRVPNAKLEVIGSGALYSEDAVLGPLGVASQDYEDKCILPFLTDADGHLMSSVTFLGRLGEEKKSILHKALIGVPNPTGDTENCPGSALEFQACGTAVVSGAFWGMNDTILHNKTGLLGRNEKDLEDNIVYLLENPAKAQELAEAGPEFVKERYNWKSVVEEWSNLALLINLNQAVPRKKFKSTYFVHYRWLIIINRILQKTLGRFLSWPSFLKIRQSLKGS